MTISNLFGYGQAAFNNHVDYGNNYDIGTSVISTLDGGYVVYGHSLDAGFTYQDLLIRKIDCSGGIEWEKQLGISTLAGGGDFARTIIQNSDSTYIISGTTPDSAAVNSAVFLMKLDPQGNMMWLRHYGGTEQEDGQQVKATSDGGYIICGWTKSQSASAGFADGYIVKTDSAGAVEWEKRYGGTDTDYFYSVDFTTDGGYILGGITYSYGLGGPDDLFLVKVDSLGEFVWQKTFGSTGNDYGQTVLTTLEGGYIFVGHKAAGAYSDAYIVKTDSSGIIEWEQTFGTSDNLESTPIIRQLSDSSFMVAGSRYFPGNSDLDIWAMKLSKTGDSLWSRTWGNSPMDDYIFDFQITSDGGYIFTGQHGDSGVEKHNMWIIKTDSLLCDTALCAFDCMACDFILPSALVNTDTITVQDSGSFQFSDASAIVNGWQWEFGDGDVSQEQNPAHYYTTAGNYTVTLYASYGTCEDTAYVNVVVEAQVDTIDCDTILASFALQDTLFMPDTTLALAGPSNAETWDWTVVPSNQTSIVQNPTFNFASVGTYTISLVVGLDTLCWDSVGQTIVVVDTATLTPQPPKGGEPALSIFPNPNNGQFVLKYEVYEAVEFILRDVAGKTVIKRWLAKGKKVLRVNNELPAGTYFYSAGVLNGKMVVK